MLSASDCGSRRARVNAHDRIEIQSPGSISAKLISSFWWMTALRQKRSFIPTAHQASANRAATEPRPAIDASKAPPGLIGTILPPNNVFASQVHPPRSSASVLLTKGVTRLEGTLKLTTAILALAAGVHTFLGVRELLNGNPGMVLRSRTTAHVSGGLNISGHQGRRGNFSRMRQLQ
jgi:hypothetical protein